MNAGEKWGAKAPRRALLAGLPSALALNGRGRDRAAVPARYAQPLVEPQFTHL